MTPHRVSKHGSYRIDLVFPGIGRIAVASGVRTKQELDQRKAMLHELYDAGQWDVLQDLLAGRFRLRQVYAYYKSGRIGQLSAEIVLEQPLATAITTWLPSSAKAAESRRRYATSWGTLQRAGVLPANPIVKDLARVDWEAAQRTWTGGAYDWRMLRGFVSHFLTDLLRDEHHPFRRQVLKRFPMGDVPEGRVPDLTPETFWQLVAAMPEHTRAAPVALVLTGMRVGELMACRDTDLQPLTHSIRIPGQHLQTGKFKSAAAVQPVDPSMWAWIKAAIPFGFSEWTLRDHWATVRKQFGVQATLHDLRHCFGQWLINAGSTEASVQRSLRHKTAAMTRRYTMQQDRQANARAIARILTRSHSGPHSQKTRKSGKGH